MHSQFSMEVYAEAVMRERLREAAQDALAAQLPHGPLPRPDLAARLRVASAMRALAIRLDPCAAGEPAFLTATPR
jgi:hypothetical protein